MDTYLFNRKHLFEYSSYGAVAGILYASAVWYVVHQPDFRNLHVLYVGCFLFMFTILFFSIRIAARVPENRSTWTMMIEAHLAVAAGIIIALALSALLWAIYKPPPDGALFPEGDSSSHQDALNMILLTATMGNFGGAAFISAIAAYAIKPDQTTDQTPELFEESPRPDDG